MPSTLSYHNFSWRGDPKWAKASRFTLYAPIVVCFIFLFSVVQIALGSIWVVQLGSNLTVPMIVQTLLLPGCSFFNALPSIHLHMLLRSNPPTMAIWFGSIFVVLYLTSVLLMLGSCASSSASSTPHGLRNAQCPVGTSTPQGPTTTGVDKSVWAVMVAFQWLSVAAYVVHGGMGWYVRRHFKEQKDNGTLELETPEEIEARNQKARELWVKATSYDGL